SALVVEKQPVMASLPQRPQIVKTGVRFTVSVRFLANLPRFKYQLRVKPEFDKLLKPVRGFRQFRISKDDSKVLDEDTPGGGLVAEFCHMSLKEAKAKVKGTTETRLGVTEELHLVTFVTEFRHAGLECTIEASSLPLVVISSSNQVVSAWASIMWCSALCTGDPANLSLFVEPPPLPWTQLSQLLSWQFLTVGRRQLDPDQLSHLREKFLGEDFQNSSTGASFSRWVFSEILGSALENWIWIDGILELIKKHLVNLWKEGLIMGFVSRKGTKELLRDKENGTFLLRFSESSKEGAITFSWVEHINGETQVHAVQPYTSNELSLMSLPRILHHFNVKSQNCSSGNPLLYLYPRIPKDSVF
uniref:SH2 domain-containing protein n=1 Tax=Tetraodon nigroviridis TaxID=99883 RepID=H3BWC5_TETNG